MAFFVLYILVRASRTSGWASWFLCWYFCSLTFVGLFSQLIFYLFVHSFCFVCAFDRFIFHSNGFMDEVCLCICDEAKKGKKVYMKIKLYEREHCYWMKECWKHWMAWCWLSISCCVLCASLECVYLCSNSYLHALLQRSDARNVNIGFYANDSVTECDWRAGREQANERHKQKYGKSICRREKAAHFKNARIFGWCLMFSTSEQCVDAL